MKQRDDINEIAINLFLIIIRPFCKNQLNFNQQTINKSDKHKNRTESLLMQGFSFNQKTYILFEDYHFLRVHSCNVGTKHIKIYTTRKIIIG